MKKIVVWASIICSLLVLSLSACGLKESEIDITPTTNAPTGQSFEEWTEEYLRTSQLAKKTNLSAAAQQTTTKAPEIQTTATQATTTTERVTLFTMVSKTTRTATQTELDMLYGMAYNKVMADYYKYQIEQRAYIAEIEAETAELKKQASDLYVDYKQKESALKERYASMNLLNSGAYKAAVKNLETQYKSNLAPISKEIDGLEEELTQAKADYAESEKQLDDIIQSEYLSAVEEFQQKTLS